MKLSILSPERQLLNAVDHVEEVTLPGSEGQIQILPGHAPMIGMLQTGVFNYQIAGESKIFGVISTGFFEVKEDEIQVLAETIELKGEIDINRAKKAQQLAEQTLKEAELDERQFRKYQLKLQRSLIRQNLVNTND